jgi:Cu/Ag efflux pump CusA
MFARYTVFDFDAWVGTALSGIAVLNGLVMLSSNKELVLKWQSLGRALIAGCICSPQSAVFMPAFSLRWGLCQLHYSSYWHSIE